MVRIFQLKYYKNQYVHKQVRLLFQLDFVVFDETVREGRLGMEAWDFHLHLFRILFPVLPWIRNELGICCKVIVVDNLIIPCQAVGLFTLTGR